MYYVLPIKQDAVLPLHLLHIAAHSAISLGLHRTLLLHQLKHLGLALVLHLAQFMTQLLNLVFLLLVVLFEPLNLLLAHPVALLQVLQAARQLLDGFMGRAQAIVELANGLLVQGPLLLQFL